MVMGGGGGGGGGGIIIIVMLICCFCVVSGIGGFWTCTGGTWDPENFDSALCLKIPGGDDAADDDTYDDDTYDDDDDDDDDTDTIDLSYNDPSELPEGEDFVTCDGLLMPDDTNTCFTASGSSAGVRWTWSDSPDADECKAKVARWRIDVSSSSADYSTHDIIYTHYTDVGSANAFGFTNAPNNFLAGQNIRFKISALDENDELVMRPIEKVLDANESATSCADQGVGTLYPWAELGFSSVSAVDDDGGEPEPDPDPIDCSGGRWQKSGNCMVNGAAVDPSTCGPSCVQTYELVDYTPAQFGGTCVTSKSEAIGRESCQVRIEDPAIDCVVGDWFNTTDCTATCGGGTRNQNRPIIVDDENNGQACPAVQQSVSCNTSPCAVNCVGEWRNNGAGPTSCVNRKNQKTLNQIYVVTTAAAHGGSACAHTAGDTKRINDGARSGSCGSSSGGGGCFLPETNLKLKNGDIVAIKDLKLDDVLNDGSVVNTTMQIRNISKDPFYKIFSKDLDEYIYVTGSHYIQEDGEFVKVEDAKCSEITEKIEDTFICLITSNHNIVIGEYTFWDWADTCDACDKCTIPQEYFKREDRLNSF